MDKSLNRIIRWFCRKLTLNQLHSAVAILLDILSGKDNSFELKPEINSKSANYRKFTLDELRALTEPPAPKRPEQALDWKQLQKEYFTKHGKELKPVRRRAGAERLPEYCHCEHCGAPSEYLYLNDGRKGNQIRCKVCGKLSSAERARRAKPAKYYCPHCGYALFLWKESPLETIYKCPNSQCLHYLERKQKLSKQEAQEREGNIYNPNYKLHYQYREYHLSAEDMKCARPLMETKVDLRRIHNTYHTAGLVLSLFINIGLSSRQTREVLKGFFGIEVSRQTVINYVNAAAALIAPWLDKSLPKPSSPAAGDETYIIVENQWHYTWLVIDSSSRAICGYNLSDSRETATAFAALCSAFGPPESSKNEKFVFIRDGLGSYDAAIMAYNQKCGADVIESKAVIGLENNDPASAEYRPFKQLIERLNRTYKFHTRPRAGFKSLPGAISMTVMFVAYYNYLRKHSARLNAPPLRLDAVKDIQSYPKQWEKLLQLATA